MVASHPSQRIRGHIRDSISSSVLRHYIKRGKERRGRGVGDDGLQPGSRKFVERGEDNV